MNAFIVYIRCRKPKFEKQFTVRAGDKEEALKWGHLQAKALGNPDAAVEVCQTDVDNGKE